MTNGGWPKRAGWLKLDKIDLERVTTPSEVKELKLISLIMYLKQGPPELLTTSEIAKFTKLSPRTIQKYVRDGKLKSYEIGGKYIRVDKRDLADFLEQLRKNPK